MLGACEVVTAEMVGSSPGVEGVARVLGACERSPTSSTKSRAVIVEGVARVLGACEG